MTSVAQFEVDGVPVFCAGESGQLTGGLIFRVGQADESLPGRGVTHLIEHLALGPLVREHRSANGAVGMTLTRFEVAGEPAEVCAFLKAVTQSLAALWFERLPTELRVLRTEEQRRSNSLSSLALSLRFGPAGYGIVDCPELGLVAPNAEAVDAWRRRWFTRANAAVWLSGPLPEGLDLSALPEGERIAPPAPAPYPYRLPAWYPGSDSYIGVSLLAPRSVALWTARAVLGDRLYDRLRAGEGHSYEVSVDYDRLTAADAALLVLTDALPEAAEQVRDAVSVELHRLARSGATDDEVAEVRRRFERARRDPDAGWALAERFACDTLMTGAPESVDDIEAQLAVLTGAEVGTALRDALRCALWLVPGAIGMYDRRVRALPLGSEVGIEGRAFPRVAGIHERLEGDVLHVGSDGVSIAERDGLLLTVTFDACLAVQRFDDGARVLWGADSLRLIVHPGTWTDGEQAVAAIDELVDPRLVVAMGEPSGYEPPVETAGSTGLLQRLRRRG